MRRGARARSVLLAALVLLIFVLFLSFFKSLISDFGGNYVGEQSLDTAPHIVP